MIRIIRFFSGLIWGIIKSFAFLFVGMPVVIVGEMWGDIKTVWDKSKKDS